MRVELVNVLELIVKVVQSITCVLSVRLMLSLATSLTEFAKSVSRSVAIAQAAALVYIEHARGDGVTVLPQGVGAPAVPNLGRVPSADVRRKLPRHHRQGRCATSAVKVKTNNVSRIVAFAQAAALVVLTHARGSRIIGLIHTVGATFVRRIGCVPSADVRRELVRNHLQGRNASIVVKVKTWPSMLSLNVLVWSTSFSYRKTKSCWSGFSKLPLSSKPHALPLRT